MRERRLQKGLVTIILLICLIVGGATNVLANAVISSVKITVRKNEEFRYPTIEVPSNAKYQITNQTDWSKAEENLRGGDEIYCTVTVTPNEGYRFNLTDAITVSGARKRNVRKENGAYIVEIYYTVSGKLEVIQNVWWDYGIARCDEVPNATEYEFKLYRNDEAVGSVRRNDEPEWNFRNELRKMRKGDKVRFKVRAINEEDNIKPSSYTTSERFSDWEDLWYDEEYDDWWHDDWYWDDWDDDYDDGWNNSCGPNYNTNGTPESYYKRNPSIYTTAGATNGYWVASGNDWRYYFSNGEPASGWIVHNRQWYYINPGGKMSTGWMIIGNNWYYLSTYQMGNFAEGSMFVGWQKIEGKWYYFYEDGRMAANTRIDNSHVGSDGSWIGDW